VGDGHAGSMRALAVAPLLLALVLGLVLPVPADAAQRAALLGALDVLHGWDDRRAEAWAGADEVALRSLYVPGSAAGRADVAMLRAYERRGAVVRRLVTQVFAVRVLRRDPATVRLAVFDRVAGGEVVVDDVTEPLPSSAPAGRVITFRLWRGEWRVAAVSDSGRDLRAARR
jgi:hypothetical protein